MNRAPLLRPESAQVLVKDLWFRVRREPKPGPRGGLNERPTVWVDFYHKKNWVQTSAASSALLTMINVQKEIAMGVFLTSSD
jgi:hypothetical protein